MWIVMLISEVLLFFVSMALGGIIRFRWGLETSEVLMLALPLSCAMNLPYGMALILGMYMGVLSRSGPRIRLSCLVGGLAVLILICLHASVLSTIVVFMFGSAEFFSIGLFVLALMIGGGSRRLLAAAFLIHIFSPVPLLSWVWAVILTLLAAGLVFAKPGFLWAFPLLMCAALGPFLKLHTARAWTLAGGNILAFFTRPISGAFFIGTILCLIVTLRSRFRSAGKCQPQEDSKQ